MPAEQPLCPGSALVILSDRSLREAIAAGRLVVDPLDDDAIQPSSIDVRLDNRFRVFYTARHPYIDVKQPMDDLTELVEVKPDDAFILHPGEFVLGSTLEEVGIPPDLAARLEGKSSLGRLGGAASLLPLAGRAWPRHPTSMTGSPAPKPVARPRRERLDSPLLRA